MARVYRACAGQSILSPESISIACDDWRCKSSRQSRGRKKGQREGAGRKSRERKSRKRASRGLKLGETLFNARLNSRRIQTLFGEHLWNLAVFDETVVEAKI